MNQINYYKVLRKVRRNRHKPLPEMLELLAGSGKDDKGSQDADVSASGEGERERED